MSPFRHLPRVIAARPKRKNEGKWDELEDMSLEMLVEADVRLHSPFTDPEAELEEIADTEP